MSIPRASLLDLGRALAAEGRLDDAIVVFEHLSALSPAAEAPQRSLAAALGAKGDTLGALARLAVLRRALRDPGDLLSDIQTQSLPAVEKYNAHLAAGEIELAERYAAALAELVPLSAPMQAAALTCNMLLKRPVEMARYARALLAAEPDNGLAQGVLMELTRAEAANGIVRAAADPADHPLIRLRDIHDAASGLLCQPLNAAAEAQIQQLLATAQALIVPTEPGSEWAGWDKHYRLLLEAVDLGAIRGATPVTSPLPVPEAAGSTGAPLTAEDLRARADRLGAKVVFFAAADQSYVDLYARWYALSILKHADVPYLIVVHVIGGAGRLAQVAKAVGIDDERLVFTADAFDAAAATVRVYDAPPKGLIAKPVAHLQSIRFIRLGGLLETLARPVFVSDIDLLLQRGVADLLTRTEAADLVFNENEISWNAGSRLTANLMLVRPTANAQLMLRFLRRYLETRLAGAEVTRWIDQVALLLARHHLTRHGDDPQIAYFDTASDINNLMYPTYQAHPFRFLSLYHGFDTSSLEGLGLETAKAPTKPARRANRRSA